MSSQTSLTSFKKKSKLSSLSTSNKDQDSNSSFKRKLNLMPTNKSTFKDFDSDPYRLTCLKLNEGKKKKNKSLKMVRPDKKLKVGSNSMRIMGVGKMNSRENEEKDGNLVDKK